MQYYTRLTADMNIQAAIDVRKLTPLSYNPKQSVVSLQPNDKLLQFVAITRVL